jgi:outer membrane immunogenic protein
MSSSIRSAAEAAFFVTALSFTATAWVMPSMAADTPIKAPAVVTVYNWSGCYVGGNAGSIGGDDRFTNYPGPGAVAANGLTPADVAALTTNHTPHESGFAGGAQAGCNWQPARSPFVLGIEFDFNGSSLRETTSTSYPLSALFAARTETNTKDLTWFSTFRGRAGYAMNRWLVYATGGLAVAQINTSFDMVGPPLAFHYQSADSRTRVGYTVGAGLEYAFADRWSAKLEYLFLDFGTYTVLASLINAPLLPDNWATDVRAREHIVRAGLNYKF